MESRWCDEDANKVILDYEEKGVSVDIALRIYTSRLLGRDPKLVLHGGGNTSVKSTMRDVLGEEVAVLCVKGSGWDLADIEPAGLPALKLAPLGKARNLEELSDEDMVSFMRGCLLDSNSPNPSVETLLHAFIPEKFVDHSHSTAVLSLTNQANGEDICRKVFGDEAALVPYVMPGFELAKKAAEIYQSNPGTKGLILLKHGIFSFAGSARESYERMIDLVSIAEDYLADNRDTAFTRAELPPNVAGVADVAPIIRGALSGGDETSRNSKNRVILEYRSSETILNYVDGAEVTRYSQQGVVTPDHTIRIKNIPLILPAPETGSLAEYGDSIKSSVKNYISEYNEYFEKYNGIRGHKKTKLDPIPKIVLVPGMGMFGGGKSAKDACIAADLEENNIEVITDAESIGNHCPASEGDMFDLEYWSLEQAKLGKSTPKSLEGHIVLITGGGGGIGAATAREFADRGAHVSIVDCDIDRAEAVREQIGSAALSIRCDVTDPDSVREAFDETCTGFGGIDIVISNAGAAWQGKIGDVSEATLRISFELNFFSHQTVAQNAVRIFKLQNTGGVLLFNASKQAVNPGKGFGPYGLPKAATLLLSRQYALEYGELGIRSNAVNADRVNTGLFANGLLEERAAARGIGVEEYLQSDNLLKREVKVDDVAKAFVALALAEATTGAVLTVDGGNIAAALR